MSDFEHMYEFLGSMKCRKFDHRANIVFLRVTVIHGGWVIIHSASTAPFKKSQSLMKYVMLEDSNFLK